MIFKENSGKFNVIMNTKSRVKLIIKGHVQGVFFRVEAKNKADALGLAGWVTNTDGGHVEAIVEGDTDKIKEFVQWCSIGPDGAEVDEFEFRFEKYAGEFHDFQVRM